MSESRLRRHWRPARKHTSHRIKRVPRRARSWVEFLEDRRLLSLSNVMASWTAWGDVPDELAKSAPIAAAQTAFLPAGVSPLELAAQLEPRAPRKAAAISNSLVGFISVGESEPNDSAASANPIPLGFDAGEDPAADVQGNVTSAVPTQITPAENDGAIPLANATGLTPGAAVIASATIGNGPFGGTSGDYDYYSVPASAGAMITVDINATSIGSSLDAVVGIYDSQGTLLDFNDDSGGSLDSFLSFVAPADDTYFVVVFGFFSGFQSDPFDSSSGGGADSTGPYDVIIGLDAVNQDFFALELNPGDILGASVSGGATHLTLRDANGNLLIGTQQDVSFIYPFSSPLPGGGNAVLAWVVDAPGTYTVAVDGGDGSYNLGLRLFRPALEAETRGTRQALFLDFDGATVDASIFGGSGVRFLSPLNSFLGGWGLGVSSESAVIDAIVAAVSESFADIGLRGNNGDFDADGVHGHYAIDILNSRDHADPFGLPNVSRVVVGGSIAQLGISTIGIAESIDVANFNTQESAVVLLDLLSAPGTDPNSLNQYALGNGATIVDLIGVGVGNIVAHEAGHFFGNFHTDQFNSLANLMDQGGNLDNTVGVGPNRVFQGGAGDDVDVDFGADTFVPNEGFTGTQDTLNSIAFGLSTGTVPTTIFVLATNPPDRSTVQLPLDRLEVTFSAPYDPATLQVSDLSLSRGTVTGVAALDADTVEFTLAGIDQEGTLTISIAGGAVTDLFGNFNAAYSGSFTLDIDTVSFAAPLASVGPPGSLIYEASQGGLLAPAGDADRFTIELDAGQTLSVIVTPVSGLRPVITVDNPSGTSIGSVTATAAGENAVLETVPISSPGTYTITLSGAGASAGQLTAQVILNAAVEQEPHTGTANDDRASAESLSAAWIELAATGVAQRAALLGSIGTADPGDFYAITLAAGQSASLTTTALGGSQPAVELQNAAGAVLATDASGTIGRFVAQAAGTYFVRVSGSSGTDYSLVLTRGADFDTGDHTDFNTAHALVTSAGGNALALGASDGSASVFSFDANEGDVLTITTWTPSGDPQRPFEFHNLLDPRVELYDAARSLAASDDNSAADGSNALVSYTVPAGGGGTHFVRLLGAAATVGEFVLHVNRNAAPVAVGNTYTVNEDAVLTVAAPGVLIDDFDPLGAGPLTAARIAGPSNGTLTLNSNGSLTYTPAANFSGADSFTYRASDGALSSNIATVTINVEAVNDAPVNTLPAAQSTLEDNVLVLSTGNGNRLSIADIDSGTGPVQVTLTATPGTLSLAGTAGLSFLAGTGTADAVMIINGTTSAINAALDGLKFTPAANVNGPATIFISTNDLARTGSGGALSDSDTLSVNIVPVNDAPVLDTAGAPSLSAIAEDATANLGTLVSDLVASAGNRISDADTGAVQGIAVVATDEANGRWEFSTNGGAAWTPLGTPSAGSARLLAADANTRLRLVPNLDFNGVIAAAIEFKAWDQTTGAAGGTIDAGAGGGSSSFSTATETASLTVTAVNDAPVNTAPAAQVMPEDGGLMFSSGNGNSISIADVDAGTALVQLSLTASSGTLALGRTTGLAFSAGGGVAPVMTFTGTLGDLNAALEGLVYTPAADFNGSATILISTNDLAHAGSGGALIATDTVLVNVTPVNDAPRLDGSGGPALAPITEDATDNAGGLVSTLVGSTISDVDSGALSGIAVTGLASGRGTWQFSTDAGANWTSVGAVSDTAALLLRSNDWLRFVPDGLNADSASITYRAWDQTSGTPGSKADAGAGGGTSAVSTTAHTATLAVTAVNDAPQLDIAAAASLASISEDDVSTSGDLVADVIGSAVSDPDAGSLLGMAVTGLAGGRGTWQFSINAGATWAPVGAVSDVAALLLRAIDRVRFVPDGLNADSASLTYRAWDQTSGTAGATADPTVGGGTSSFSVAAGMAAIQVTATNDAPQLDSSGSPTLSSINEDALNNAGDPVSGIVGATISDVDSGALSGIAVVALASGRGAWQFSTDSGVVWTNVGAVSDAAALLLRSNDRLRFVPDGLTADSASITYRAWDQASGTPGTKANASAVGGATAFSAALETAVITVNEVNDAPQLDGSGSPAFAPISEDAMANSGELVSALIGNTVQDVDLGAVAGIAITGKNSGRGTWQFSTSGGANWAAIGTVSNGSALLLRGSDRVRFVPDGRNADSASLTYRAWDQTIGAAGAKVDASVPGGVTAFSTLSDTATITVTAANDPPLVLLPATEQQVREDAADLVFDLAGVFDDVDFGDRLLLSLVANSNPSLLIASLSGTVLQLDFLSDQHGLADLTVRATDLAGDSVEDRLRITVIPENDRPVAVGDVYVLSNGPASTSLDIGGPAANDVDVDGDRLVVLPITGASHGTIQFNPDGSLTYTKGPGFAGIDRFSYQVSDGRATSNASVVTVLSHEASIVRKFYLQLLSREPEDQGLKFWAARLVAGQSASVVFEAFYNSDERLNPIVRQFYLDYLLRPADAEGLAFWRQAYIAAGGPETVVAGMISSPEFFLSAGGTDQGYVAALYQRLLGRAAEPSGLRFWTNQLELKRQTGRDPLRARFEVATEINRSEEGLRRLIDDWHRLYLGRPAASAESDLDLRRLLDGTSQRQVQASLIDRFEYRNSPPLPTLGTALRSV